VVERRSFVCVGWVQGYCCHHNNSLRFQHREHSKVVLEVGRQKTVEKSTAGSLLGVVVVVTGAAGVLLRRYTRPDLGTAVMAAVGVEAAETADIGRRRAVVMPMFVDRMEGIAAVLAMGS
jgi:hypothetical protein